MRYQYYKLKLASVFVLLFLLSSCQNDIATIKAITGQEKLPIQKGKGIETIYSDSAKVKIKMISAEMDRYMDKDNEAYTVSKGVTILFYSDNMSVKSQLTADNAIRYEKTKSMEAKHNVVVINEKGEKLNTEHLIWDEEKKLIHTNAFVKITAGEEVIYGEGLESNQNFTKYKILKPQGTMSIKDEHNE